MPPASLSTFAVIIPGPTTAKNSRVRPFQRLPNFMRTFRRHRNYDNPEQTQAPRLAEFNPVRGRIRIHWRAAPRLHENESLWRKREDGNPLGGTKLRIPQRGKMLIG